MPDENENLWQQLILKNATDNQLPFVGGYPQPQKAVPIPPSAVPGGNMSLGQALPMNPFLAGMQNNGSTQRKDNAEKMLYELMKKSDNTPSLDAQKQSVEDYAAKVKAYADKPVGGLQSLNLQPLAALSDAWNPGARTAQSYTAPETQQERATKALMLQGNAASLQGALTKEQTDLMKSKLTALVGIDKANKDSGMANSFLARTDETNHRTVLQDIKKDETLKQRLQQSTNLANSFSALDNAKIKTPQQFDTVQQAVRGNMGIKGTSGLDERERDYFNNLGLKADRVEQMLFSKPVDIGESQHELITHLRDLVGIEQGNIQSQADQRLQTLTAGNEAMYQRRPDLWGGIQNVVKAAKGQFNPNTIAPPSQNTSPNGAKRPTFEEFKAMKAAGQL
jgi:hypothetical protein